MITNNTNYLEQIYDAVKNYEDVDDITSVLVDRSIKTFESDCTSIGNYTFCDCFSLTSVNLLNCTTIGNSAFRNCTSLTSIELPNTTSIGGYAFNGCTSLTTVDLPNTTSIRDRAFYKCDALIAIIIRTNTLCVLEGSICVKSPTASTKFYIYVPKALIEDYKVAENWSKDAGRFRALEDYTVDGTTTGELNPDKI